MVKILLRTKSIEVTKTTDWVCVDIQELKVVGLRIYLPGHNQESGTKPYLVSVSVQQLVDKNPASLIPRFHTSFCHLQYDASIIILNFAFKQFTFCFSLQCHYTLYMYQQTKRNLLQTNRNLSQTISQMPGRSDTKCLVVHKLGHRSDSLSYSLTTDLPHNCSKHVSKLLDHIDSIIEDNEKYHDGECKWIYIGKSTIHKQRGRHFDAGKPHTWDKELIEDHWRRRKKEGYQAMAVLTVVTEKIQHSAQRYTISLKKKLIVHLREENDKRLKNKSTGSGRLAEGGAAYVLYLAMKFEDESSSDSESD